MHNFILIAHMPRNYCILFTTVLHTEDMINSTAISTHGTGLLLCFSHPFCAF